MAILRVGVGLTFNGINGDFTTSGIVTAASFSGTVIGIASTARSLTSAATGSDLTLTTGLTVGSAFIRPTSVGLGATTTTGRNAGVGTATGTLIYNSTTGLVEVYNGSSWQSTSDRFIQASGGIVTTYYSGGVLWAAHMFTASSTFNVLSAPSYNNTVEYLVVAGGGGGGTDTFIPAQRGAGGGGAGGFRTGIGFTVNSAPGSYTVTVGGGGGGGANGPDPATQGSGGTPSWFGIIGVSTITSTGGGGYS